MSRSSKVSVEVYDCGCRVRFYQVETGEWEGDLPEQRVTVSELNPCPRHNNNGHSTPPTDARLASVFGERESFLAE